MRPDLASLSATPVRLLSFIGCLPGVVESGYSHYVMVGVAPGSRAISAYRVYAEWQFVHGWLFTDSVGHPTTSDVWRPTVAQANYLAPLIPMALPALASESALTGAAALATLAARSARAATVPWISSAFLGGERRAPDRSFHWAARASPRRSETAAEVNLVRVPEDAQRAPAPLPLDPSRASPESSRQTCAAAASGAAPGPWSCRRPGRGPRLAA